MFTVFISHLEFLIHSKSSIVDENNEGCIINSITVMQMNAFPSILNLNMKHLKPKINVSNKNNISLEDHTSDKTGLVCICIKAGLPTPRVT